VCLISEHREIEALLMQRDLTIEQQQARITELTNIISEMEIPPRPEIELFPISRNEVSSELRALGVELIHQPMDASYNYTNTAGWMDVWEYVYFVFPWPKYTQQSMDCEDFGILLKGLVSAFFGTSEQMSDVRLNTIALALGNIPAGYHGFNVFRDEQGWMCIEPQSLVFFSWGDRQYEPEKVLI
jgi:hypothetical protein